MGASAQMISYKDVRELASSIALAGSRSRVI